MPRSGPKANPTAKSRPVVTTQTVADVLAKQFGIRHGYTVARTPGPDPGPGRRVHEHEQGGSSLPELGATEAGRLVSNYVSDLRNGGGGASAPSPSLIETSLVSVVDVAVGDVVVVSDQRADWSRSWARQYLLVRAVYAARSESILDDDELELHGYLVVPAAATILHDTLSSPSSSSRELFVTFTRAVQSVAGEVRRVRPQSIRIRLAWDAARLAYVGIQEWAWHQEQLSLQQDRHQHAPSPSPLQASNQDHRHKQLTRSIEGMPPLVVHEGDFVYLRARSSAATISTLLDIVQIDRIGQQRVSVRRLRRQALDHHKDARLFKHETLLEPDETLQMYSRTAFVPVGKCFVSIWTDACSSFATASDQFHVLPEHAHVLSPICKPCNDENRHYRRRRNETLEGEPLKTLELFSGAGGLSIGLALCGACETKCVVDLDAACIKTFRSHHPHAKIHTMDVGAALQHAVSGRTGPEGRSFPRPGQIDVVAGGPPCQGFSFINRHAPREAANRDSRNLLVASMLGWVEYLGPSYVVLENVLGFAACKLGGRSQGMVKLVMHALIELGYAVTVGFVQSGAYGCPQSRNRFILLAARVGLHLPRLPLPTHAFAGRPARSFSWTDGYGAVHFARPFGQRTTEGLAPLPAVTIWDAISDLPKWDWKDPHVIYPGTDDVDLQREAIGIPQVTVKRSIPAGERTQRYTHPPQTSFQERMRVVDGRAQKNVHQHQTSGYDARVVERVVNVALRPGATFESWYDPDVNKTALLPGDGLSLKDSFKYERLVPDSYFKILVTTLNHEGSAIHPDQRRLVTVRECARAQGIPDFVRFTTEVNLKAAYRQIGNAVPVPLAQALGTSLLHARISDIEARGWPAQSARREGLPPTTRPTRTRTQTQTQTQTQTHAHEIEYIVIEDSDSNSDAA
ncbi:S-adenosyl-L-methionine-dependent methyltransferase [Testicularia cyperi]|uniref:Cytosine-specific methyltransferase n=1 Tax=Testicularia cyperi TaxID=1882483 RepID=A0A317XJA1_9BASI|nr:S-adenosyl-L-methionine-dependent methyltransferase [Testicularia cyperi]